MQTLTNCAASSVAMTLEKLAAALGCPVSAFSEPPSGDLAETAELLRLWSLNPHEQDRAAVLAFLRSAVPKKPLKKAAE